MDSPRHSPDIYSKEQGRDPEGSPSNWPEPSWTWEDRQEIPALEVTLCMTLLPLVQERRSEAFLSLLLIIAFIRCFIAKIIMFVVEKYSNLKEKIKILPISHYKNTINSNNL